MRAFWLGFTLVASSALGAAPPRTLEDCYRAALVRSAVVATQQELVVQAEERFRQAIGAVLPNLSLTASYFQQQQLDSQIFPTAQPLIRATVTQPLFQGFREFAGFSQTRASIRSQKEQKAQAEILLFQDTAQSFYQVASLERDIKNLEEELQFFARRIDELREYVKIGRSRENEILTVQTQREQFVAQLESIRAQLKVGREILAFLTGLDSDIEITEVDNLPEQVSPLTSYLERVEKRPDVQAAQHAVKAAESDVDIANAGHYPTVNLTGNYYALRFGVQKDVTWDAQVQLVLPIFTGGVVEGAVDIARSRRSQSELALLQARRLADQQVRTFYYTMQGDRAQVDAFRRVTDLAEKNYKASLSEYKKGLTNNIDVLQSLAAFKESNRAFDRSRFLVKLDFARLESSVGKRPQVEEK